MGKMFLERRVSFIVSNGSYLDNLYKPIFFYRFEPCLECYR